MTYINPDIQAVSVHSTLWQVKNVFTSHALGMIALSWEHDTIWKMDRPLSRLSFDGEQGGPLSLIGNELAGVVSNIIDKKVKYATGKVFVDLPGSQVPRHYDDPSITVMSQFYLDNNSIYPIPGTTFLEPFVHTIPYEFNCGYINLNADKKIHQSPILKHVIRTSVGYQFF
jgi:hypothetical protein